MYVWRGFAAVGVGALVVATLAFAGDLFAVTSSPLAAVELVTVAYAAFFAGAAALVAAALGRGTAQLRGVLRSARQAD